MMDIIQQYAQRTHVFATVDALEYLRRSYRVKRFRAGIGIIVKFKPILIIHSGQPGVTYVRTEGKTLQQVLQMAKDLTPLETIALVHANASEDAQRLLRQTKGLFSPNCKALSVDVAPVLGAHISPGVVGFALIKRA